MIEISVILPTFNRADMLSRAIKSVLNQTYQDFELIIVDDHSIDNTKEIVMQFKDERIKYILHENNKGGSIARNTGIKKAIGKYIALIDDDDEWLLKKLEIQYNAIRNSSNRVGLIYCGFYSVNGENNRLISKFIPKIRGHVYHDLLKINFIGSCSFPLIRKECFEEVGYFDEQLPSSQDFDMWLRIAKKYEIDYVSEILVKYYFHGNQITSNFKSKIIGNLMILEKYFSDLNKKENSKILSIYYKKLALRYLCNSQFEKSKNYYLNSFKLNLTKISVILNYIMITFIPFFHQKLIIASIQRDFEASQNFFILKEILKNLKYSYLNLKKNEEKTIFL